MMEGTSFADLVRGLMSDTPAQKEFIRLRDEKMFSNTGIPERILNVPILPTWAIERGATDGNICRRTRKATQGTPCSGDRWQENDCRSLNG